MTTVPRLCAALVLLLSLAAEARDERMLLSVEGAMNTPEAHDRLDDTVEFYWGEQAYPKPLEAVEIFTVKRSTYALNKTDLEACDWAFLSAIVAMRDRAKELGANAIVEIKSIYRNREFRSETQYECRAGYLVTGVSLEGKIVKLPPHGVSAIQPGR